MSLLATLFIFLVPIMPVERVNVSVVDVSNGAPISYVTIVSPSFQGVADESGHISLPFINDTITFQCVGYISYRATIKQISMHGNSVTVMLTPKVFKIDEINVTSRRVRKVSVGFYKKDVFSTYHSSGGTQLAVYIPSKQQYTGLPVGSVNYYIRKWGNPTRKFRVHLYAAHKGKDGGPGEELLPIAVYGQANQGDEWVNVRVRQYGVKFPDDGLFAAIEFLPDPIYDGENPYKNHDLNLGGNRENQNEGYTWWFYLNRTHWTQSLPTHPRQYVGNAMIYVELIKEK